MTKKKLHDIMNLSKTIHNWNWSKHCILISKFDFQTANIWSNDFILVIINVDVNIINNICVNRLFDSIINKFNSDRAADSEMIKEFFSKCFHHYDEVSLSFHIFRLKMSMLIMLFRNIKSFVMCNETRARLIRIIVNVLEIEIIVDKSIDEKILFSRISLNSKNDKINKNRKKKLFRVNLSNVNFLYDQRLLWQLINRKINHYVTSISIYKLANVLHMSNFIWSYSESRKWTISI